MNTEFIHRLQNQSDNLKSLILNQQKQIKNDLIFLVNEMIQDQEDVIGICWRQYIPHFNDGDPCKFTIDQPSFITSEKINPDAIDENDTNFFEDDIEPFDEFNHVKIDGEYFRIENGSWDSNITDSESAGKIRSFLGEFQ